MSEQEQMDRLLRSSMGGHGQPRLSGSFERRLTNRIRPWRLSKAGRMVLAIYAVVAVVMSVWLMRVESFSWPVIALAIVVPAIVMAIPTRRYVKAFMPAGPKGPALRDETVRDEM